MIQSFIEREIQLAVSAELDKRLLELPQILAAEISKPEYTSWGRYLTYGQAMAYMGIKSKTTIHNMVKENPKLKVTQFGRHPKIDREVLDKMKMEYLLSNYKKSINDRWN